MVSGQTSLLSGIGSLKLPISQPAIVTTGNNKVVPRRPAGKRRNPDAGARLCSVLALALSYSLHPQAGRYAARVGRHESLTPGRTPSAVVVAPSAVSMTDDEACSALGVDMVRFGQQRSYPK